MVSSHTIAAVLRRRASNGIPRGVGHPTWFFASSVSSSSSSASTHDVSLNVMRGCYSALNHYGSSSTSTSTSTSTSWDSFESQNSRFRQRRLVQQPFATGLGEHQQPRIRGAAIPGYHASMHASYTSSTTPTPKTPTPKTPDVDSDSDSATAGLHAKLAKKDTYMLFHPQYDLNKVQNVKPSHRTPIHVRDYIAYGAVQLARWGFDKMTGYEPNKAMSTDGWLTRFIFLETVAGVPGMVGAMLRHMMSLRTLKRDHGWIHTLLEEAENERMHLLTFLKLREPGIMFRLAVLGAQGVFFNAFFVAYIFSPRTCHRFVGYLEEEAVRTYTHALHDIDGSGPASEWARTPAPVLAIKYWRLPENATVRDVVVAVRADEASHSHVNHTLSSMGIRQTNPFHVGHTELPENFVDPPAGFIPEHNR